MISVLAEPHRIDLDELENYVLGHPHRSFFQSSEAFRFFSAVKNHEPVLLVAKRGQEIVGTLQAVVIADWSGSKGYFTKRAICWGGPLVSGDDPEVFTIILEEFDKIIARKALYSQFRNLFDMGTSRDHFEAAGWHYEEHLDIIVDLTLPEDQLWSAVHTKRRNEIRRAQREGTEFRVIENKNELTQVYDILREVYSRARLPLPALEFFRTAYDVLSPHNLNVFLAVLKGEPIGTMLALTYDDTIYDWYAGSYQRYYAKYPNDLIPWQVFLWGKRNGYKKFDFGGAGKPNVSYGVRDYKKKFGGTLVNYGRFEKIHKPLLYRTAKVGFHVYQKIRP